MCTANTHTLSVTITNRENASRTFMLTAIGLMHFNAMANSIDAMQ